MKRKLFALILFIICICCAVRFLSNENSDAAAQKVVLLIDDSTKINCMEIDLSDGSRKPIQELGNWMEGNYMFACNEGNLYYVKKKGEKRNIYRMDLGTGKKKKIYSTRNTVVGLENT